MLHRSEAIVLKSTPFSEADLIVTALTSDYGLVKTFAKSPRKTKSRFGSSLEPLTYTRLGFWGREDADLPRLTQSDIIRPFQAIRDRMASFFSVMELVELTLRFLPEREQNRDVFNLLLAALNKIEDGLSRNENGLLTGAFYKIRFLDLVGYGPRLAGCGRCGASGRNFYSAHGSILCGSCAQNVDAALRLSPGVIGLYATLRRWDIARIERVKPSAHLFAELSGILNAHIEYTAARPLKTRSLKPQQ